MYEGIPSNFKIGVLGGGQLGRMMIQSAIDFNLDLKIIDPDPNAPCSQINSQFTAGSIKDYSSVLEFGQDCDLVTIEIENVNTEALKALQQQGKRIYPQPEIIELIQDKRVQKQFYEDNGIPTSEFFLIIGHITIWKGAMEGGMINPSSSPCIPTIAPSNLSDIPYVVW